MLFGKNLKFIILFVVWSYNNEFKTIYLLITLVVSRMIVVLLCMLFSISCVIPAVPSYDFTTINNGGRILMSTDGFAYTRLNHQ